MIYHIFTMFTHDFQEFKHDSTLFIHFLAKEVLQDQKETTNFAPLKIIIST